MSTGGNKVVEVSPLMTNSTWHVVIVTSVPGLALAPCQHPWNNKTLVVARTPLGPPTLASLLSVLLCGEVLVHGSARVPRLTHGCHSLGARALPGERQCSVCSVTGGHSRPVLPTVSPPIRAPNTPHALSISEGKVCPGIGGSLSSVCPIDANCASERTCGASTWVYLETFSVLFSDCMSSHLENPGSAVPQDL